MPYVKVEHKVDPKQKILDDLGDIFDKIKLTNNQVAVVVYQRPTTTTLGGKDFFLSDETVKEDQYQSKVGLIVAMGPTAFQSNSDWVFAEDDSIFKLHEWVALPPAAANTMMINGILCRVCQDTTIKAWVSDPDIIY